MTDIPLFSQLIPPPPTPTLFPYTTLFRSAIDPRNENIWYVVGYEDHCVWKIEIEDMATNKVRVSVFAGDPNHTSGFDLDRKSTRLNSSHRTISYAVFCLKKKTTTKDAITT